ncbi:MAG TPA: hypothetical protein VFY04_10700 [Solirubrobacterales bacterium]|nr:hypothetical protein [Solirubrobacterales bacterium]
MRAVGRKRIGAVPACLLVGVAVLAGGSSTAGAGPPPTFPVLAEFKLDGSKGYRVSVYIVGSLATIQAESGNVAAEYTVEGKRVEDRFVARFGRRGRLALRYRAANRRQACELFQRGVYRGVIEFVGERRYTEVHAKRARGSALALPSEACLASSSAVGPPPIVTHLHAVAKRPGGAASVSAFRVAGFGRAFVLATLNQRRERMEIARYAFALVGGRNAFIASGPGKEPGFAFLKPPKPFAGSAVFEQTGALANSWSGDLSVWLPGAGRVALAGPSFSSSLCRRRAAQTGCAVEPIVRRPLAALQGSGSQSQLLAEARLSWSRYLRNSASSEGSTP